MDFFYKRNDKPVATGKRLALLILITITGIATSLWGYYSETAREHERQLTAFQTEALNQSHAIESYIDFTLSALPVLATTVAAGLSAAKPPGNPLEQTNYRYWERQLREPMQNAFRNYHAIQTLAWVAYHETRNQRSFPVGYIQYSPFYSAGTAALSRHTDFARSEVWLKSMQQALDSGRTTLSTQGTESTDVLAFMPIFRNNIYTTRQQRHANLTGFIVAVIDRAALIEIGLLRQNLSSTDIAISIHDVTDPLQRIQLYLNAMADRATLAGTLTGQSQIRLLEVGGLSWMLQFEALAAKQMVSHSYTAWIILLTGLLLTGAVLSFLMTLMTQNARIESLVGKRTDELEQANRQLRDSEMLLVQAEKMSALGQMVAGVAHEINTPLGFAKSNLQLMEDYIQQLAGAFTQSGTALATVSDTQPDLAALQTLQTEGITDELVEITRDSLEGIARISDIVTSLKDFSRMDRLAVDDVDLHQCIDSTLMIAHNAIKHKADVIRQYGDIPNIHCAASQINQVLLNIITNAAQAIGEFGSILIDTSVHGDFVHIVIKDNGKGMSKEVVKHIFEPFYTTKEVGEGTGLGLAISDKIVRQHHGRILVRSNEGLGTTFTIALPIRQPQLNSVAEAA